MNLPREPTGMWQVLLEAFYGRSKLTEADVLVLWSAKELNFPTDISWEVAFVASRPLSLASDIANLRSRILTGPCRKDHAFDAATDNWTMYLARPQAANDPGAMLVELVDPLDHSQTETVFYSERILLSSTWITGWSTLVPKTLNPLEQGI